MPNCSVLNFPVPDCPKFVKSGFLALGSEEKCFFSKSPKWPIFKLMFPDLEKYFGNFPVSTCFAFFLEKKLPLGPMCYHFKAFFPVKSRKLSPPFFFSMNIVNIDSTFIVQDKDTEINDYWVFTVSR